MPLPRLIGLVGFANSGKDTAADALPYPSCAFGDSLKDAVSAVFGISRTVLEGKTAESRSERERSLSFWERAGTLHTVSAAFGSKNITPRMLLIHTAATLRNNISSDIFVLSLEKRLTDSSFRPDDVVVIKDCRFPNEMRWIKQHGGLLFCISPSTPPPFPMDLARQAAKRLQHVSQPTIDDMTLIEIGFKVPDPSEFLWLACEDLLDGVIVNTLGQKDEFCSSVRSTIGAALAATSWRLTTRS